jgi:ubiquinone/menaquinone biosynthesis C-methylase UbiE
MAKVVCPYWLGYFLVNPLRRFAQDPEKILGPYVTPGMTVLDVGSGMGFFSLPLARMVGPEGRVMCVDVQEKMIRGLQRRARKARLTDRIAARVCRPDSLDLAGMEKTVDFALAFDVAHEMPDIAAAFGEISRALKSGGTWLLVEPRGHVSAEEFAETASAAEKSGFSSIAEARISWSRAVALKKI